MKKLEKKVILPSTFVSGDRFMHQNYQDAIGLIQRFGKPHLFITMTTNPDWDEIQQQLKEGETALDRPDIVARIFKLKKQQLIQDIEKEMIFGKIVTRGAIVSAHFLLFGRNSVSTCHRSINVF